jgi:hypothetical protein
MVKYVSWGEYHWRHQRHLYYQRNKKLIEELKLKQLEKVLLDNEKWLEEHEPKEGLN